MSTANPYRGEVIATTTDGAELTLKLTVDALVKLDAEGVTIERLRDLLTLPTTAPILHEIQGVLRAAGAGGMADEWQAGYITRLFTELVGNTFNFFPEKTEPENLADGAV